MAKKGIVTRGKKKTQVISNNKENSQPWPDLPDQIINLIKKQTSLIQCVGFSGVSKKWRAEPRQCNPTGKSQWPVLSNHEISAKTHHIYRLPLYKWIRYCGYGGRGPRHPPKYCVGSSHGKLVIRGAEPSYYEILTEFGRDCCGYNYSTLPPWDTKVHFGRVVLSSSPDTTTNCTVMVLTGASHPGFMFYKLFAFAEKYEWIKEECSLLDPHSSCEPRSIQFTNAIGFKGKFYTLSLQGTLAVIDVDPHPRVTILGVKRAIPSTWSKGFREYLVESCGEILLVFLISRKSMNIVDDVEVLKLDLSKRSWIKMESLGNWTLFLGLNCSMSASASKLGCRKNCIYFTHHTIAGWWVFNMESRRISLACSADFVTMD